jgi:SAM-dependent methyltransferase
MPSRWDTLATLDLTDFNNGVNPWHPSPFISIGFREGADFYRTFVRKWNFDRGLRIVDVGSGYGRWSVFLAEVNKQVYAFDRNEQGVALARRLAGYLGLANLQFEVGDAGRLPLRSGSVDGVWCNCGLHMLDRARALREAHRILVPDGVLFLGEFNGAGKILQRFFTAAHRGGVSARGAKQAATWLARGPLYNGRLNYATIDTLEEMLDEFGFSLHGDYPVEIDVDEPMPSNNPFASEMKDLSALGRRLESDGKFALEFSRHCQLANLYPSNIHCLAIRT